VGVTMTWIGLDVHARSVEASVVDAVSGELHRRRVLGSEITPLVEWLGSMPAPVRACYEAGPTGYGLARAARAAGISMDVIAPSKTPRRAGERIKTDRRDAEHLVRQLMAGSLTAVRVPSLAEEAARDVVRPGMRARASCATNDRGSVDPSSPCRQSVFCAPIGRRPHKKGAGLRLTSQSALSHTPNVTRIRARRNRPHTADDV